eukprot:COSAG01_NODE_26778_length_703_cov_1.809603_1_plen_36_part_10
MHEVCVQLWILLDLASSLALAARLRVLAVGSGEAFF